MEPEHLRESSLAISNMEVSLLVPEDPRQCQESPTPVPPPVMVMMETILEFEEEEVDCSTPVHNRSDHLNLISPVANTSFQFQSPEANSVLYHLQSPMDYSHPLPPVNTPTTGHGQAALLHSCQQQLVVTQAAAKLAAVTGPSQQMTAGPGMQLLRDSLAGLCGEQQQETEELLRTAAAFIKFCRRNEGEELGRQFKIETRGVRL
jgi:hypothetical protein